MKKFLAVVLMVAMALPAVALDLDSELYVGGTLPGLKEGTTGQLRTDGESELVFTHEGGRVAIPYRSIVSYHYTEELARHLGVALTIAVVLVKHRQRRHFINVEYKDSNDKSQVAVFEVPKDKVQIMVAVLKTRSVQACDLGNYQPCKKQKKQDGEGAATAQ